MSARTGLHDSMQPFSLHSHAVAMLQTAHVLLLCCRQQQC
jgi:hypothetical protein